MQTHVNQSVLGKHHCKCPGVWVFTTVLSTGGVLSQILKHHIMFAVHRTTTCTHSKPHTYCTYCFPWNPLSSNWSSENHMPACFVIENWIFSPEWCQCVIHHFVKPARTDEKVCQFALSFYHVTVSEGMLGFFKQLFLHKWTAWWQFPQFDTELSPWL